MSALRQAAADYFAVRRVLGFKLERAEKLLDQFIMFLERRGDERITTEAAVAWATQPQAGQTWSYARLSVIRRFAVHIRGLEPATEIPPTDILVQRKGRATPFLYSADELADLARAADALMPVHRSATVRTLILLLAVTGLRVGEAIRLDVSDFDARLGLLTIRNTKFGKTREVPLHPTTVVALTDYLDRDDRPVTIDARMPFFLSTAARRLKYCNLQQTFRQLCRDAGLQERSTMCRPRIHDLRHSFAVNTIRDGYCDRGPPGDRIALLATYLGHVDPSSTYWYLSAAPELMALAGERLQIHLGGEL